MNELSYRKHIVFRTALTVLAAVIFLVGLIAAEFGFRWYLSVSQTYQPVIQKLDEVLEQAWFEPHPQLVYTFKPNYTMNVNVFGGYIMTTDSFQFRSGLEFDVESKQKLVNEIRIATIGGSTTMGVNNDNEIWAYITTKELQERFPQKKFTLVNEGLMGYNSQDNLIDLSVRVVDFDPDIYVLYLGVNDYLMQTQPDNFRTDYAHGRATLYENISFSVVDIIPDVLLGSKMIQYGLYWSGVPDRRHLLNNTGTSLFREAYRLEGKDKLAVNPLITDTVIRNTRSMIGVIRAHNPEAMIVLSTFYYFHDDEKVNDVHQEILKLNKQFKSLAQEMGSVLTDPVSELPYSDEMVYDYGHFKPEGDIRMGMMFAETISNELVKQNGDIAIPVYHSSNYE